MNNNIIETALSQIGVKEIVGSAHNPEVLKYFKEAGHEWVKDDEMAWCSAFANWVALKSGFEYSGALNARSWLKIGEETKEPETGDIVVFWRGSRESWKGHVGFFISKVGDKIYTLGGNQSNQVCITSYHKDRILGFRKLNHVL